MSESIYVCYVVSVMKETEESLRKRYEVYKLQYDKPYVTFERFMELQRSWRTDKCIISSFEVGYFDDKEDAVKAISSNMADINECGAYPFAAIVEMPKNCFYPNTYASRNEVMVFKFDQISKTYVLFDEDPELANLINQEVRHVFEAD